MTQEDNNKTASLQQELKNEIAAAGWPKEGVIVEAELIKKLPRELYFDLGKFGTGIVYGLEFINAGEIVRKLSLGDRVPAKVVNLDGERGYIELSLAEAGKQKLWQQVIDLEESGEVIKAKIVGANAGGLLAALPGIDVKAFLPTSQLSSEHYPKVTDGDRQKILEELQKLMGQEFNVKVIDVNPRSNKLIVSEREILNANLKELLSKYQVGQTVDGIVSGVANFGAFVHFIDNPEIEGLVHISELDHRLIDNPKDIVNINEPVKVKIVDIRDGRVFLSLKALKTDPWDSIKDVYIPGYEIRGRVFKLNPFGAIIDLEGGIQGMIHVSEFGGVDEMKKELIASQTYQFVVSALKPEEKRIILKLKK